MSEKKKQEYTTGGLKNRQDVEHALASAEYRPSQEVTDAASDLKQWQANRPGDYESAYQGRIDGLMEDLLDRKEFSYSYGADPLYRQYAQLYTQNAQNASADAAAQAAALTGGYGSSYAASAAGIPAADRCTERGHPHAVPAGAGYLPERRRCLGGADRPAERAGAECPAEV